MDYHFPTLIDDFYKEPCFAGLDDYDDSAASTFACNEHEFDEEFWLGSYQPYNLLAGERELEPDWRNLMFIWPSKPCEFQISSDHYLGRLHELIAVEYCDTPIDGEQGVEQLHHATARPSDSASDCTTGPLIAPAAIGRRPRTASRERQSCDCGVVFSDLKDLHHHSAPHNHNIHFVDSQRAAKRSEHTVDVHDKGTQACPWNCCPCTDNKAAQFC